MTKLDVANEQFEAMLFVETRKNLVKRIGREALRGVWTHRYRLGSGNSGYEVHIPKNSVFPKGYYWSGRVASARVAKYKVFSNIITRLDLSEFDGEFPIKVPA